MSCNGCRVLRKGCSDSCILRSCLQWIESPEAQGHATVFVAKFFGRAGLISFLSSVPLNQRPALFQSLLFEAAGRTVNPVNGAVGLLWTGNWHVCQAAVETVLQGGMLSPVVVQDGPFSDTSNNMFKRQDSHLISRSLLHKRRRTEVEPVKISRTHLSDLDLCLTPSKKVVVPPDEKSRLGSPSMNSEESGTTTCLQAGFGDKSTRPRAMEPKLLNLFN